MGRPRKVTLVTSSTVSLADVLPALESDINTLHDTFLSQVDCPANTISFATFLSIWESMDISIIHSFNLSGLPLEDVITHFINHVMSKLPLNINSVEQTPTAEKTDHHDHQNYSLAFVIFSLFCLYFSQPCPENFIRYPISISEKVFSTLLQWAEAQLSEKFQVDITTLIGDVISALLQLMEADAFKIVFEAIPSFKLSTLSNSADLGSHAVNVTPGDLAQTTTAIREQLKRIDESISTQSLLLNDSAKIEGLEIDYYALFREIDLTTVTREDGGGKRGMSEKVREVEKDHFRELADIGGIGKRKSSVIMRRPSSTSSSLRNANIPRRPSTVPPQSTSTTVPVESSIPLLADMPDFDQLSSFFQLSP